MSKAMRHPADHDPYRFFFVLFVEGKGYISNFSAWRTGKEHLQYDANVARASFWDGEDAVVPKALVHYTQRNSKGILDLDAGTKLEQKTVVPNEFDRIEQLLKEWWKNRFKSYDYQPPKEISTRNGITVINYQGVVHFNHASVLLEFLIGRGLTGISIVA